MATERKQMALRDVTEQLRGGIIHRSLLVFALLVGASAIAPDPAHAATVTWTGVGGGPCLAGAAAWSASGPCWSTGAPPADGDDVVLAQNGVSAPSIYDINRTLSSITLNPIIGGATAYTISNAGGFLLGLQSGGFITDNNTNSTSDAINTGITLNGPATFTLSAGAIGLSFGTNAITGTGPLTLTNSSANDALQLNVANTYTGATTASGTGRVRTGVDGAIPTGSALTVNGSVLFQMSSTMGSLAGGGTVFMNGSNTLTVGGDNTSTTFSGVYQDSGGSAALTKTGTGTFTLSGANTYAGATAVNAGTLAVTGSIVSPVTVISAGTLGGTGMINNSVTVNSGGTLAPGLSPGVIDTGSVTLTGGSTLTIELDGPTAGTQYDQVNVTGVVTLGDATLNVVLGFVPSAGQVFTIINNDGTDPVTGIFAGLAEGNIGTAGGDQFRISYAGGDGNDVILTAADEPPTIAKAFGAAAVPLNGTAALTFTLSNPNSGTSLTGVSFSDALPAGLVVATPNGLTGSCGGGTITATAGSSSVSLSGATLAASASCSFTMNVTSTSAGLKSNTTGAVTSTEGGTGGSTSATLNVIAPVPAPALGQRGAWLACIVLALVGLLALQRRPRSTEA